MKWETFIVYDFESREFLVFCQILKQRNVFGLKNERKTYMRQIDQTKKSNKSPQNVKNYIKNTAF